MAVKLKIMKRKSSSGRSAKSNTKSITPPGFKSIPATVATLPPGLRPPMPTSSMKGGVSGLRGKHSADPKTSLAAAAGTPFGGTSVWSDSKVSSLLQNPHAHASGRRSRARRKS